MISLDKKKWNGADIDEKVKNWGDFYVEMKSFKYVISINFLKTKYIERI